MILKARLCVTDSPEVTQVSGVFRLHGAQRSTSVTWISAALWAHASLAVYNISRVLSVFFPSSDGLKHLEEIKLNKCIYIEDTCLERLSSIENLQESLYMMEVVSCGNVTDKGIIALHRLRWRCWLIKLSEWPKGEKRQIFTSVMIKRVASTQEAGVSVPQRSARDRRQTEDDWETADGAPTAGHRTGPGLTGRRPPDSESPTEQEGPGSSDTMLLPLLCVSFVKCV